MEHRKEIEKRIKIAKGQLDGILKMIEEERDEIEISAQILASIKLLQMSNKRLLEDYFLDYIEYVINTKNKDYDVEKIEEFIKLITKV